MPPDPTLEALMAGGHFVIAADRYEEQTGDAELAALMRIDGLEWELVDDVPALRMKTEWMDIDDGRFCWWHVYCGGFDFGAVDYEPMDGVPTTQPLAKTPISSILKASGYATELEKRFYQLYCHSLTRLQYGK